MEQSSPTLEQRQFTNMVRSLFNIDGYLLPELTDDQQIEFVSDPVRYFINGDKAQSAAIFREVAKRQPVASYPLPDLVVALVETDRALKQYEWYNNPASGWAAPGSEHIRSIVDAALAQARGGAA